LKLLNPALEVSFCTGQNSKAVQRFKARDIDQKAKIFHKVANVLNAQLKVNI